MAQIVLPRGWAPRPYQAQAFRALDSGIKRVITVWHRRSGKDSALINYIGKAAHQRIGNYWHLFPTARQGRKALWEAIDKNGRRVIDQAVPPELRESVGGIRNDEMLLRLKCGSTIQVTGADQVDSLVGSNPIGVGMSEYAITSPVTWRFIAPILRENGGWAWFNSTPRGKNHLYDLWQTNVNNPRWFCSIKGWRDTGVLTQDDIDQEIRDGMPPEVAAQEYDCSFNAPNVGIVYARQLAMAQQQNRITDIPYRAAYPVETWWDIGHRDATAIWFVQRINGRIFIIDYYEATGQGLPHYAGVLREKGYAYSRHIGPHDLENKIWAADGTTRELAKNFGIFFTVAPKLAIKDGIDAARAMFSRCYFDVTRCQRGLEALGRHEFEWDEEKRIFGDKPIHDWSSHGADAFRYGAVTAEEVGIIPIWAKPYALPETQRGFDHRSMGHNGGPPMDDYDPLSAFRSPPSGW